MVVLRTFYKSSQNVFIRDQLGTYSVRRTIHLLLLPSAFRCHLSQEYNQLTRFISHNDNSPVILLPVELHKKFQLKYYYINILKQFRL